MFTFVVVCLLFFLAGAVTGPEGCEIRVERDAAEDDGKEDRAAEHSHN